MPETTRVTPEWARNTATRILEAIGTPSPHAELVASQLVDADLRGITTHGLVRLPVYVARARRREINVSAEPTVANQTSGTAVLDGGGGFGQVTAQRAIELALEKAADVGSAGVAVRNSSHLGAAGAYARHATQEGCLGVALTNTQALLPAVGGTSRVVGNNPLAIASPSRLPFPIVLDIAMSHVAAGRLRRAAANDEPIPDDWAFGPDGEPTTDAQAALFSGGLLRPMADHKGFGLSFMIDILCGALSGGAVGASVVGLDGQGHGNVSNYLMAIRIDAYVEIETFLDRVDALVAGVRSSKRRQDVERLLVPGEVEWLTLEEQSTHGIVYEHAFLETLSQLADELGVTIPRPAPDDPHPPPTEARA